MTTHGTPAVDADSSADFVATVTRYRFRRDEDEIVVAFRQERDLVRTHVTDELPRASACWRDSPGSTAPTTASPVR